MRLPGVLAQEDAYLAVLEVSMRAHAKHFSGHPEFTGLFLGQGVGTVFYAQAFQPRFNIGSAEVVSLAAATVIENLIASKFVANCIHPR